MQIAQNRLGKLSPVLFLVVGGIWLAVTVSSSELVLVWPAIASILSGVSLFLESAKQLRRPLGIASSIFGLAISSFQLYLGSTLLGTVLANLAIYSVVAFVALFALQLVLLYSSAKN